MIMPLIKAHVDGGYTMGLSGKTMGFKKKDTMGLGKKMNVANLSVFLIEVNWANPVFLRKRQYC